VLSEYFKYLFAKLRMHFDLAAAKAEAVHFAERMSATIQ